MHPSSDAILTQPEPVRTFLDAARAARPDLQEISAWEVRCIGLDAETTQQIFELIRIRDKTGTFSLPWMVERTDRRVPHVGLCLVLVDMTGRPTLLVRLVAVREALFGQVTEADTAVDGSPVRDPVVWKALHEQYWNSLLAPYGLCVSDQMPFWIESFELLFDVDAVGT